MNIRTMTAADIPFGMRLKEQNNWNQLEADWQRQLKLEPDGCFVAAEAGVACCCVFDDVAWINMVLVDRAERGRGIGTALMRDVLQYLDQRKVPCIRLDATALGQPVYAKLGFVGDYAIERYEGTLPTHNGNRVGGVQPFEEQDWPAVIAFDEAVTITNRARLLVALLGNNPENAFTFHGEGGLEGYRFARPGSKAWQVGPIQGHPEAARALFRDAAARFAGQCVYFDIPTVNTEAIAVARSLGLTVQRSFLRMTRGRKLEERLDLFWSSFGPEKG